MPTEGQEYLVLAGIIAKSQKGHGRGGRTAHPFFLSVSYNVAMGSQTEQFMRLAEGCYHPQLGSSDRLRVQNGAYTLQYKDGTTLNFTSAGNIASWQHPASFTVTFTYNAASPPLLTAVSNGLGRSLMLRYNAANQLTSVSDTGGRRVAYAYDGAGNYDGFDRLSHTTYAYGIALASSESFNYDADDNATSRTTRKGDIITFAYDTLNRLTTKTPPSPAPVVSYTYDRAGRVTSVSDTSSPIAAAVPPAGTAVQYATSATDDPLNRPSGFTWTPAASAATPAASSVTFTHAYNSANQRTSQATTDNSWWTTPLERVQSPTRERAQSIHRSRRRHADVRRERQPHRGRHVHLWL